MQDAEDEVRAAERGRRAAFLDRDIPALQRSHADDFVMVNPGGQEMTRDDYINGIALGFIEYRAWEPESDIDVRVFGDAAALRYRSRLEMAVQGELQPEQRLWHLDVYEKRDGRWLAVWSQATRISV